MARGRSGPWAGSRGRSGLEAWVVDLLGVLYGFTKKKHSNRVCSTSLSLSFNILKCLNSTIRPYTVSRADPRRQSQIHHTSPPPRLTASCGPTRAPKRAPLTHDSHRTHHMCEDLHVKFCLRAFTPFRCQPLAIFHLRHGSREAVELLLPRCSVALSVKG